MAAVCSVGLSEVMLEQRPERAGQVPKEEFQAGG